ncbi:MAG: DUF192 domain-containing protein [bacterium]|nr:DUF192 domain-containing protein [bacterium]
MATSWRLSWFAVGALVLLGVLIFMRTLPDDASDPVDGRRAEVRLADRLFYLDIVDTPDLRRIGLAGRKELPPNGGMLFRFDTAGERVFWMKGMEIPIDIIWLSGGVVSGVVSRAAPPPLGTADADIPRFASPGPVDAVIELAAGRASEIRLHIGQRAEILVP